MLISTQWFLWRSKFHGEKARLIVCPYLLVLTIIYTEPIYSNTQKEIIQAQDEQKALRKWIEDANKRERQDRAQVERDDLKERAANLAEWMEAHRTEVDGGHIFSPINPDSKGT